MSINSSGTPSANWGFGDQGVVFPLSFATKIMYWQTGQGLGFRNVIGGFIF